MAKITSFKQGGKRKTFTEHTKLVYLNIPDASGNSIETQVGAISKRGWGDYLEYRVFYTKLEYPVKSRNISYIENHEESYVLMDTFTSLIEANAYVKRHFKDTTTLKKEMFNVYIKLLNTLG